MGRRGTILGSLPTWHASGPWEASVNRPTWVVAAALLTVPFVALLWVSSYSRVEPSLFGFPFFYWYLLIWVPISSACTGTVYVLVTRGERARKQTQGQDRPDGGHR